VPPSPPELTPHVTPDTNPHVDGAADICRPCATAAAYAHVAATTRRECQSAPGTHCTASPPLVRPKTSPMRTCKAHDQAQHPGSAASEMRCTSPQLLDCLDSRAPRGPMTRCCARPVSVLPIHARPIESAATICAGPLAFFVTALPNPTICPWAALTSNVPTSSVQRHSFITHRAQPRVALLPVPSSFRAFTRDPWPARIVFRLNPILSRYPQILSPCVCEASSLRNNGSHVEFL
jgi:hypothetical protein